MMIEVKQESIFNNIAFRSKEAEGIMQEIVDRANGITQNIPGQLQLEQDAKEEYGVDTGDSSLEDSMDDSTLSPTQKQVAEGDQLDIEPDDKEIAEGNPTDSTKTLLKQTTDHTKDAPIATSPVECMGSGHDTRERVQTEQEGVGMENNCNVERLGHEAAKQKIHEKEPENELMKPRVTESTQKATNSGTQEDTAMESKSNTELHQPTKKLMKTTRDQ